MFLFTRPRSTQLPTMAVIRATLSLFIMASALCTNAMAISASERMSVDEFLERLGSNVDSNSIRLPSMMPQVSGASESLSAKLDDRLEPTPFIIGGTTAPRNRYREYVLILITDAEFEIVGACGGTMIDNNKVLTAAHCSGAPASRYVLIPGFYSFNITPTRSDLFTVSRVAIHPDYNDATSANDAAVMTLVRPYARGVSAVLSGTDKLVGKQGTVIGTGLTSTDPQQSPTTLQEVEAPITSNSSCNDRYAQFAGVRPIQSNMMCAGFLTEGRGSCSGDSGSALFVDVEDQRVVSGVVSFGFRQCELNRATQVYSRVTSFTDFIRAESPNTVFVELNAISLSPVINLLLDDGTTSLSTGGSSPTPPSAPQNFNYPSLPSSVATGTDLVIVAVGDENDTIIGQTPKIFQLNSSVAANRAQMTFQDIGLDEVNILFQPAGESTVYDLWLRTQQANLPFPDLEVRLYNPAAPITVFSDDSGPSASFHFCVDPRGGSFRITRVSNNSATSGLNAPVITEVEGLFEVSCASDNGKIRGRFRYRR